MKATQYLCDRCTSIATDTRKLHIGRMNPWNKLWSGHLCLACEDELKDWLEKFSRPTFKNDNPK